MRVEIFSASDARELASRKNRTAIAVQKWRTERTNDSLPHLQHHQYYGLVLAG